MLIRLEEEKDYREVENLNREAFWNMYRPGCLEHLLIHRLRNDDCYVKELGYVVEDNGIIVAHIAYAKAKLITDQGEEKEILIFGPVCVLPEKQGQGYGELIIDYTLARAAEMGYPMVAITGNYGYYKRFGFDYATKYGIYYNGVDRDEETPFFMVKVLDEERIDGLKGTYYDPECYNISEAEADEFDKQFPEKKKSVKRGYF